jgi:hypothetical protein
MLTSTLADLRHRHRGPVITPDDLGYDPGRITFNGMIDRRPALITRPLDLGDVVAAAAATVSRATASGTEASSSTSG